MKKLFTLTRLLHTLFGNIGKRLGRPRQPKHTLDSTPLKKTAGNSLGRGLPQS